MELKPCPVCQEEGFPGYPEPITWVEELGSYRDGGYSVPHGRYECPACGFGQTKGQSYSIAYGWEANQRMWNRLVDDYRNRRAEEVV